jgi:hypothetical protein
MSEPHMTFGDMNFQGGIQNFGGKNKNEQTTVFVELPAKQLKKIEAQLAVLRDTYPDPALLERERPAIEEAVRRPTPENRKGLDRALERLSANAGNASKAAEAIAAIVALVAKHWPF